MAELSRRSRVPVATIKYYLREGLLPAGTATAATRAEYGAEHLRRLRLIRALIEIGEIPVAAVRHILERVDDESVSLHDMFGAVQYSLGPQPSRQTLDADGQAASRDVDELIAELGWKVTPDAPARALLASTLAALRRADAARGPALTVYAKAMAALAAKEVGGMTPADGRGRIAAGQRAGERRSRAEHAGERRSPAEHPGERRSRAEHAGERRSAAEHAGEEKSRVELAESAAASMVLYERVLVALHRLAQEDASARLYGAG